MKLTVGKWGVGLEVGRLVINLFLGDIYLRVPMIGEFSYSSAGMYLDCWKGSKKGFKD